MEEPYSSRPPLEADRGEAFRYLGARAIVAPGGGTAFIASAVGSNDMRDYLYRVRVASRLFICYGNLGLSVTRITRNGCM